MRTLHLHMTQPALCFSQNERIKSRWNLSYKKSQWCGGCMWILSAVSVKWILPGEPSFTADLSIWVDSWVRDHHQSIYAAAYTTTGPATWVACLYCNAKTVVVLNSTFQSAWNQSAHKRKRKLQTCWEQ